MTEYRQTKAQLIEELRQTRQSLVELAAAEAQRRQAEAELRASRATLQLFVDHTPSAVAMFDTEMRYLAASRRWITDYELGDRPLIGVSHYEIFPEIGEDWKAVHRRCLAGAVESRSEDPFPRADGSLDWVHWEVRPWYTADECIGGIIIFTEVITQRKQAEAALLETEKRFRVAQDLSLDAFTILRSVRNAQGQIIDFEWTYANPVAGRILKHPPEELIGRRLLDVLPDNRENPALFERYVQIVESGQGSEVELEYRSEAITGWFRNVAVKLDDGLAVSFSDITPRKQAEEALRQSETRYQTLFSEMMIGCSLQEIICDEHGRPIDYRTLDVNPEFERLLGVPKAAVVGARASAFLPPAELARWLDVFGPVALTGVPARYHQDSPVNRKTFEGVVFCPQPGQFAVMFEDVTQRVQSEATIQSQLAEIAAYYDLAPVGLVVLDTQLRFLRINAMLAALNGFPAAAHMGKTVGEILPAFETQARAALEQILRTGEPIKDIEFTGETPAQPGVTRIWSESWYPLRDAAGVITAVMVTAQDITDRKRTEAALRESERRFSSAFEFASIGMALLSTAGAFLKVNQALCNLWGYSAEDLTTLTYQAITHPDDLTHDLVHVQQLLNGEINAYQTEKRYLDKQGNWVWGALSISLVRDDQNHPQYIIAQIQDIRQRKQAEEALLKSRSLLTETERLGHVGGWEFNIDTQVQTWTEEVYRIHEVDFTRQPTVVEGVNFYAPASRPIIEQAVQRAIEHGEPFDVELEIITAKGQQRWVHAIGKADLAHRRVFGFFQDITDRKRAEATLRDLGQYNRSLLEVSLDPLVTISRDGQITDVNAATETATGLSRQELIGTDFSNYFTDPAHAQAGYEQVFRDGQVRDYELELRHRSGAITSVLYNAAVYRDETGQVLGVFAAARDITQRKRAEAAEHEQRQLAEALRDSAEALTSTLNLDEVLDRILLSMERVITYDAADILLLDDNRTTARVARHRSHYAPNNIAEVMEVRLPLAQALNLQTMLLTGEPVIVPDAWNFPGWVRNPGTSWIRSNLGLPIVIHGQPIGFLSVDSAQPNSFTAADIEHLRALADQVATAIQNAQLHTAIHHYADDLERRVNERTRELAEANIRLKELDRLKDEFISRIGHELRTPLTSIKIYLELLEVGKPEKREKYLSTLKREADRLHVLIEDLLRVRQLSADAFELAIAPHDIAQLITDRLPGWSEQAARHGLAFHTQLGADLPRALIDRDYTVQVLGHLINNAINYTPAGSITLSAASRSDDAGRWVIISVQDTGPGITAEDLPHIFEQFYRGRAAADYKTPGVGVGLSLSCEIVTKMKGRLTVDTQVGVGSTFTIWLPAA